jgi:hypothetical protein
MPIGSNRLRDFATNSLEQLHWNVGWVFVKLTWRQGTFAGKSVSKPCVFTESGQTSLAGVKSINLPLELANPQH